MNSTMKYILTVFIISLSTVLMAADDNKKVLSKKVLQKDIIQPKVMLDKDILLREKLPLQKEPKKVPTNQRAVMTKNNVVKARSDIKTPHNVKEHSVSSMMASNIMPKVVFERERRTKIKTNFSDQKPKKDIRFNRQVSKSKPTKQSYIHLVLEVDKSGNTKVLSATEVPGSLQQSDDALGDFIYQVSASGQTLSTKAITDPFEMRSFPTQDHDEVGHHFVQAKKARLIVKVPRADFIKKNIKSLNIQMFKLKPGKSIQTLDFKVFEKLQSEKRLEKLFEITPKVLSPQINQKLQVIKLSEKQ